MSSPRWKTSGSALQLVFIAMIPFLRALPLASISQAIAWDLQGAVITVTKTSCCRPAVTDVLTLLLRRHVTFSTTSLRKMSDEGSAGFCTTSKFPAKRINSAINGVSPFASTYSGSL